MKQSVSLSIVLSIIFLYSCSDMGNRNDILSGKWKGIFMDHYYMVIDFEKKKLDQYSGLLKLYEGRQQVQNDQLTKITVSGSKISFYIPAKQTDFFGNIDDSTRRLSGNFIFPDGSLHPVSLQFDQKSEAVNKKPGLKLFSKEQLSADADFLSKELIENHPSLYSYQDKETYDEFVLQVKNKLKAEETAIEFYKQLSPLVASVGCSHTQIRLPDEVRQSLIQTGNYFPADIFIKDRKAYIISLFENNTGVESGDEIISINGRPVSAIIEELISFISSEGFNTTTKYAEVNHGFHDSYVLLDNAKTFQIEYENRKNGLREHISLKAINYEQKESLINQSKDLDAVFPINFEIDINTNTGFLTIPTFGIRNIDRYLTYMDSVFTELRQKEIQFLVIDLRGNYGGHPIFAAQLYSYLTTSPFVYFDSTYRVEEFAPLYTTLEPSPLIFEGICYVLIDGRCLSTTGHVISLIKYHQIATIIGEEPGSSFRCNDQSRQYVLPNSKLEVNIPTKVFKTAVEGFSDETIIVDLPVDVSVDDKILHRDPVMTKSKNLIAAQKQE